MGFTFYVDTRRLAPPLTYGGLISKKWLSV
jgi:hypothetical protein